MLYILIFRRVQYAGILYLFLFHLKIGLMS